LPAGFGGILIVSRPNPATQAGLAPIFFVFVLPAKTGYQRCLSETGID
jgi:hypothetical protein